MKQSEINFETPVTVIDNLVKFLRGISDGIDWHNRYDAIRAKEGMYGTNAAEHYSYGLFTFEGVEFGYHSTQVYTYKNFEAKHGKMPTIVEFVLRDSKQNSIQGVETFYMMWETFAKNISPLISMSKS